MSLTLGYLVRIRVDVLLVYTAVALKGQRASDVRTEPYVLWQIDFGLFDIIDSHLSERPCGLRALFVVDALAQSVDHKQRHTCGYNGQRDDAHYLCCF